MKYEKRGSVARWENGTLALVTERGVAVEEDGRFTCHPGEGPVPEPLDPAAVEATVDTIRCLVREPLSIERLLVSEGVAEHAYGNERWSETARRIHVSLVHGRERMLLDLASFDVAGLERAAAVFSRCQSVERNPPPGLRLAPSVTAALLPLLAGITPPNLELWQTGQGRDAYGAPVEESRIENGRWPNWYRPSYRRRPVRAPLHLRLECSVTEVDESRPVAVALLAPVTGLTIRVLVADEARVYPATVRVVRVTAVAPSHEWYPYGAGAYGAEVML